MFKKLPLKHNNST